MTLKIPISFSEPTCLLVSTKTRSSGIIKFRDQEFRTSGSTAHVCLGLQHGEIKSMWMRSTKPFSPSGKAREVEFGYERTAVSNFESGCDDEIKIDVLTVLPTGFGKSLIYQSLGFIFDFLRSDSDSEHAAIVVVSPLNALMQDQVEKLMAFTNVCAMKASTDLTDSSSDLRKSDSRK